MDAPKTHLAPLLLTALALGCSKTAHERQRHVAASSAIRAPAAPASSARPAQPPRGTFGLPDPYRCGEPTLAHLGLRAPACPGPATTVPLGAMMPAAGVVDARGAARLVADVEDGVTLPTVVGGSVLAGPRWGIEAWRPSRGLAQAPDGSLWVGVHHDDAVQLDGTALPRLTSEPGKETMSLLHVAPDGSIRHAHTVGVSTNASSTHLRAQGDDVVVAGLFSGPLTIAPEVARARRDDGFAAQITPDGNVVWTATLSTPDDDMFVKTIAGDAGSHWLFGQSGEVVVMQVDESGVEKQRWKLAPETMGGIADALLADDGGVILLGATPRADSSSFTTFDAVVLRLTSTGEVAWRHQFGFPPGVAGGSLAMVDGHIVIGEGLHSEDCNQTRVLTEVPGQPRVPSGEDWTALIWLDVDGGLLCASARLSQVPQLLLGHGGRAYLASMREQGSQCVWATFPSPPAP